MGFGNIVVFSQVVLFFLVFVLSFFIFIPLSVNVGDFSDHCLLFADGDWTRNQSDFLITAQLVNVKWGPGASCNYPIFIGVLNMIIAIIYVVRESKHLFTRTDSSWRDAFGTCLLCFVVMVMGFAAALTVNSGFQAWCKLLLKPGSEINSCENGEYMSFGTKLGIKTDRYFLHLQLTQFGVWSSWFCWVVLSSLTIIKIYRYSRQEAFLTSMNRERERLVQRLGPQQQEI